MAFKFIPVETIKRIVELAVPADFDQTTKADIEVTFKRLPFSKAKELIKQIADKTDDANQILLENVVNIDGVKDADDNDVPFSKDLLKALIEESYIRNALIAGFMSVNYGLDKLRAKN